MWNKLLARRRAASRKFKKNKEGRDTDDLDEVDNEDDLFADLGGRLDPTTKHNLVCTFRSLKN